MEFSSSGMDAVLHKMLGDVEFDKCLKPCVCPSFDLKSNRGVYFHSSPWFRILGPSAQVAVGESGDPPILPLNMKAHDVLR